MPKLTKRNYFSLNNKHISNSKIKDYLKDKNFFYRRHCLGEILEKTTDPLILGSATDCWLTEGEKKFREKYIVVTRRVKLSPDYKFQLNQTMYTQVEKMCRSVMLQDAYKKLRGHKSQQIIRYDMPIGIFEGLCAIPDWCKITGDTCIITDLKTTDNASAQKHFYKCLEYGYFRQMAMIRKIIKLNFPEVKNFEYRHIVVEKDPDEIYNCYTFLLSEERVDEAEKEIDEVLEELKTEKKFLKKDAKWDDAVTI